MNPTNVKLNVIPSLVSSLCFWMAILFLLPSKLLLAQTTSPEVSAYQVETPISVDGQLDEEAWQQAEPVSDFRQFEPREGDAASQRTEVRVLYGAGNIYIGAILYDEQPEQIEQTLGRRDEYNRADWFTVSIDSYFDRRTAYSFGVNAAGVQFDAFRTGGGGGPTPGMDTSWDAVWYSSVQVTDQGWIVEMQIPYSMLRFSEEELQTWGIHFSRRIPRQGEESEWPLIPRTERENLVAQFGRLAEIRNIKPSPNIQVTPYSLGRLNTSESETNPGELATQSSMDVGGDIKIGLGPNVTMDATINPDFGQVESDPAVLNLTAFETFYDERRPFFLEGANIYEFSVGPGELLYTRRIGAEDPIIGATKVSGRTAKGLSFGVLGATTGDSFSPTRNSGVARMSQQLGDFSSAGGILTAFDGPNERGGGRIQSLSGGADWDLRMLDNQYGIEGFSAFTHRNWTTDQDAQTGFAGKVWMRKRQGVINGFAGVDIFSDQFNPNELGQLRENNFVATLSQIEYQINGGQPFGSFQRANVNLFGIQQFSYREKLDLGLNLDIGSEWMLESFQQFELEASFENIFGGYDLFETRGLGPWARPSSIEFASEFETDDRRNWEVEPEVAYTITGDGGRGYSLGLRADWDAGSRLSLSGNLEGEWENNVTAWVSNESFRRIGEEWQIGQQSTSPEQLDNDEYVTFEDEGMLSNILLDMDPYDTDQYYVPVFGGRDTRSLDFTLRGTVTFTPDLSLQLYSQLFLARGHFDKFRILENPDQLADFDPYPKRNDFTLNSLQSNVVLRWEYRPGSTLFLVWTQGRSQRDRQNPLAPQTPSPYNRSIGDRIGDTFDIFPQNVLLAKIKYTFLY